MIVARKPKHKNYKTHLLSHECNETLDQTGAELENLGHSVQVLLVTVCFLLQYHSIEIDEYIRKDQKTKRRFRDQDDISGIYKLHNKQRQRQAPKTLVKTPWQVQ